MNLGPAVVICLPQPDFGSCCGPVVPDPPRLDGWPVFFRTLSRVIALTDNGQYTDQMQELFSGSVYLVRVNTEKHRLTVLREAAKLTVRELARQVGVPHTNILFWERTGQPPRSDVLLPMSKALGVTVEELLGESKPRRATAPGGKTRQVFDAVSQLPRRQQQKIVEVVQALVAQHGVAR